MTLFDIIEKNYTKDVVFQVNNINVKYNRNKKLLEFDKDHTIDITKAIITGIGEYKVLFRVNDMDFEMQQVKVLRVKC